MGELFYLSKNAFMYDQKGRMPGVGEQGRIPFEKEDSVIIDNAGRIVTFSGPPTTIGFRLTRRLPNGELDKSFAREGHLQLPETAPANAYVEAKVFQAANGYWIAGSVGGVYREDKKGGSAFICPISDSGALNLQYGSNGCARMTSTGTTRRDFSTLLPLGSGEVLVGVNDGDGFGTVVKFDARGQVATSFADKGSFALKGTAVGFALHSGKIVVIEDAFGGPIKLLQLFQ